MPSWFDVFICAGAAALFWTLLGLALAGPHFPKPLRLGFAPVLGWAAHSAVMLPVHQLIGLSPLTVRSASAALLAGSLAALSRRRTTGAPASTIPAWAWAGAAMIAALVAAAIMPKEGGTVLASPIFDHAKVAIVDEIARLGVPPGNPFFAAQGPRLPYYYLWHFSAAEIALAFGVTGWTADAALTGVTAFASLTAMIALAVWWGGRSAAAWLLLLLALTGSLRPLIELVIPRRDLDPWFLEASGLGAWLFQAAWVPQHLAAATCVLVAAVLIGETAREARPMRVVLLGLLGAAAIQSSTYVGGVTFGLAATVTAYVLIGRMNKRRLAFLLATAIAAMIALALAAPLLRDQWAATAAREMGAPIAFMPTEVFGPRVPETLRRWLDLPGFWLIYLPIELPAIFVTGVVTLRALLRASDTETQLTNIAVATLAIAALMVSWLLASTFGNNDLGWRASLPPIMVLTAAAAAGLARCLTGRAKIAALVALLAGLPAGALMLREYLAGSSPRSDLFAATPEMWQAVREQTSDSARIANNPQFLQEMTPWRGNISWALLANRRSCFAADDLVFPFVALPHAPRRGIDAQFIRMFAGEMTADEIAALLRRYGCDAVVLTAQDGAWARDPFPAAGLRLAASRPGAWRVYVRMDLAAR